MTSSAIIDFLVQKQYGCVRFDSNKDKLSKIIPEISGETKTCVLRNNELDLKLTQNYLDVVSSKQNKICLMTSYEFLEDIDVNMEKYSLLFIDSFQKTDYFTLSLMNEWYARYKNKTERIPYLLLGSVSLSYQKIPIPLPVENFLDLNYTTVVSVRKNTDSEEIGTIVVNHSKENYDLGSDELYKKLTDIVKEEVSKYKKGDRAIIYVPDEDRMQYVSEILEKVLPRKIIIINLLYDTPVSIPYRENNDSILIILSLDYTGTGIYFPNVTTVFDSGEINRLYTTKTGGQDYFLKKIDRQEMELRRESHMPKKYIIMIPSESVKNLRKNTVPISYRINIEPHILHLFKNGIKDITWACSGPVQKGLDNLQSVNAVDIGKNITEIGLFSCGLFEEGFDLDIYNSTFLYIVDSDLLFSAIVMVSLFQHKNCKYFTCGTEETFKNIYYSLTRLSYDDEENTDNINKKLLEKMLKMIKNLCDVLCVEKKIYNPKLAWDRLKIFVENIYKHRLCRYDGGKYVDGYGNIYRICGKHIDGNISKIILPVSVFCNEKQEFFTDFYVCMESFE